MHVENSSFILFFCILQCEKKDSWIYRVVFNDVLQHPHDVSEGRSQSVRLQPTVSHHVEAVTYGNQTFIWNKNFQMHKRRETELSATKHKLSFLLVLCRYLFSRAQQEVVRQINCGEQ